MRLHSGFTHCPDLCHTKEVVDHLGELDTEIGVVHIL